MSHEIIDQTPQPDLKFDLEEIRRDIELTPFGRATLASVVCGRQVTNADLIDVFRQRSGDDSEKIRKAEELLEATGITERRASWEITSNLDQIVDRTTQIGAHLITSLMKDRGWDTVDAVIDTSASLPEDIGKKVIAKANLNPNSTVSKAYRVACAGAIAGLVDTLADPEMKGKRVIVCALEPLSQHVKLSQCTLEDSALSLPAIFGDDFAAIAFDTADYEIIAPKTHIVFDGAPIRFYQDYNLSPTNPNSIPPHYTFGEGGRQISSISENGVLLAIQRPENNMPSAMDGYKTFKFFVPETMAIIEDVIKKAHAEGIHVRQAIMHQPSKKVNEGFQRQVKRTDTLRDLMIPDFKLGEIGRPNSSSATSLVIWQHLAKEGEVNPNEPILICAPGIGSAISAGVIVPK